MPEGADARTLWEMAANSSGTEYLNAEQRLREFGPALLPELELRHDHEDPVASGDKARVAPPEVDFSKRVLRYAAHWLGSPTIGCQWHRISPS